MLLFSLDITKLVAVSSHNWGIYLIDLKNENTQLNIFCTFIAF